MCMCIVIVASVQCSICTLLAKFINIVCTFPDAADGVEHGVDTAVDGGLLLLVLTLSVVDE